MQSARSRTAVAGELTLIERIRHAAGKNVRKKAELRLGIGDDCAILRPRRGEELVVTTDFSLEGRHFRRDWHSAQSIGHRVLARGLSDVAAMGARPMAAFLSLALPALVAQDTAWMDGFLEGLLGLAMRTGTPLAGGDTSESPGAQVLADIVLLGAVPQGRALRRAGAQVGDRIFVTGALGGAAAELAIVVRGDLRFTDSGRAADHPHLFPEPRLRVGQALVRAGWATAGMDLSDGLSTDLRHLCDASGVAAEVDASRLPLHPLLTGMDSAPSLRMALHGGEDYELLFTVRPKAKVPARIAGVPVTEIGRVLERQRGRPMISLIDGAGRRSALAPAGWEHFK